MPEPCTAPSWTPDDIRKLLTALDVPQGELAAVLGVDPATVSRWLRGPGNKPLLIRGPIRPVLVQLKAQSGAVGFRERLRLALASSDPGELSSVIWERRVSS